MIKNYYGFLLNYRILIKQKKLFQITVMNCTIYDFWRKVRDLKHLENILKEEMCPNGKLSNYALGKSMVAKYGLEN